MAKQMSLDRIYAELDKAELEPEDELMEAWVAITNFVKNKQTAFTIELQNKVEKQNEKLKSINGN
jgi:hypothetical protein